MTHLLQRALAEIEKLPAETQDAVAARILADLEDERAWTASFKAWGVSPPSYKHLAVSA